MQLQLEEFDNGHPCEMIVGQNEWSDMSQLFQVLTIRKQLRFLRIKGIVS